MERNRRLCSGRMSEIFGDKTLQLDKFALSIGYREVSEKTWESLKDQDKKLLQAYADGVNDYLEGVGMFQEDRTASLLPPEFGVFGIKEVDPWTPVDSLVLLRMINLFLSYNWSMDMIRDVFMGLENGKIKDLHEELMVFTSEHAFVNGTILDEDDLK
mmetsp:Transcript_494/g.498  ORF Transcript_494/g.498 Transcript_494/m.498 type:complete len:158 (+) Transcript_494:175-648(+)